MSFLVQDGQPGTDFAALPAMMLQPRNRERSQISLPINQNRFPSAKMSNARPGNAFWEMPIAASAVLHQFFFPMMYPYVLQVGHGALDYIALACSGIRFASANGGCEFHRVRARNNGDSYA